MENNLEQNQEAELTPKTAFYKIKEIVLKGVIIQGSIEEIKQKTIAVEEALKIIEEKVVE